MKRNLVIMTAAEDKEIPDTAFCAPGCLASDDIDNSSVAKAPAAVRTSVPVYLEHAVQIT
jgi:hypothetical protein